MEEKTVLMVLKVDLECDRCCKKVKKVLAKFPQIRDQAYNEKQGIVLIKVVCCKPEMIMKKICCKGDGSIKSIEIKEPEKKKEEKKEVEKPKVVAQPVQGYSPPPYPVYYCSCYEGRPCYRCYVGMPVYDSYGGGYGGRGYCNTGCSVM
ncbi:protein PYRICULARIA ORYZAE RESISTANCE 21-like isoform X2 [Cucurbita maxima]|uniref:Protein PYRICULARIA ORYZAE RESISTANCE 21-like isoform X2 n=1 Tax=Cucurbita maxima TaxID=3661 RepID=A0A6J1IJ96_CUCMA|nr:protein PYRICULARIA ORYZAE RESISTANCE 21-like isoform X2 [Cucurbita maxima]